MRILLLSIFLLTAQVTLAASYECREARGKANIGIRHVQGVLANILIEMKTAAAYVNDISEAERTDIQNSNANEYARLMTRIEEQIRFLSIEGLVNHDSSSKQALELTDGVITQLEKAELSGLRLSNSRSAFVGTEELMGTMSSLARDILEVNENCQN
jgi:hypothetical protein